MQSFILQLLVAAHQQLDLEEIVEHIQAMKQPRTVPQTSSGQSTNVVTTALTEAVSAARKQPLKVASECQILSS